MTQMQQVLNGVKCSRRDCKNFARNGHDTCRWHDPARLAAQAAALEAQAAELRSGIGA